jgi:hypothetical protein
LATNDPSATAAGARAAIDTVTAPPGADKVVVVAAVDAPLPVGHRSSTNFNEISHRRAAASLSPASRDGWATAASSKYAPVFSSKPGATAQYTVVAAPWGMVFKQQLQQLIQHRLQPIDDHP